MQTRDLLFCLVRPVQQREVSDCTLNTSSWPLGKGRQNATIVEKTQYQDFLLEGGLASYFSSASISADFDRLASHPTTWRNTGNDPCGLCRPSPHFDMFAFNFPLSRKEKGC
jgi:hypothetical protein